VIKRFRARLSKSNYSFYVWENGGYVHVDGGEHASNDEAASAAARLAGGLAELQRPASLDAPHIHIVREDGVHILTLELPNKVSRSAAA
jgi:hypothetical protein